MPVIFGNARPSKAAPQAGSAGGGNGNYNNLAVGTGEFRPRSETVLLTTDQTPEQWVKAVSGATLLPQKFLLVRGDRTVHFRIGPIHLGHLNFGEAPEGLEGKEPFAAWCRDSDFAVVGCGTLSTIAEAITALAKKEGKSEICLRLDCSNVGLAPGRYRVSDDVSVPQILLQNSWRDGYHDLSVRIREGGTVVGLLAPPAYPQLASGGERWRP